MTDPVTPNYSWTLPTVGADSGTWGTLLNANWTSADTAVKAVSTVANAALPAAGGTLTGAISASVGNTAPFQWNSGDAQLRKISNLITFDFSTSTNSRLQYDTGSGKLTFLVNNVAVFSVDGSGNLVAKGTITASGTP